MIQTHIDQDGVVTLLWDTPGKKQNVFDAEAMTALANALEQANAAPGAIGIVITSGKRDFIAGADISMLEGMAANAHDVPALYAGVGTLSKLLRQMEKGKLPVAAAINGTALGGGLELALACHRRFAADQPKAVIGLPEATLGLLPGAGGTQRVPRLLGVQASLPLLMEGKRLSPAEAKAAGLIDELVAPEALLETARAWIRTRPAPQQPWDKKGFKPPGGTPDEPAVSNLFMVAAAMLQAKTYGNYPAGQAILSCVNEGLRLDMDAALEVEKRYFVGLIRNPVARNMIRTMFGSLQDANKLVRRPAGVERLVLTRLGVLGSGLMGAGIAYSAARAGIEVVVIDTTLEKAEGARTYAERLEDKAIASKRGTEARKAELLARIHTTIDFEALRGCSCVVEAVFEDRAVKAEVTRRAEAVLSTDSVFASNTSTLPITGLAEASTRPENFIGLHFFSPVEKMQLVEVIKGRATSPATLARALDVVVALGKTPIVVNDSRGFYTSRVFGTYVTEGMAMLREGITPALIENAGKMSGMPMPPLALADDVGLGLMVSVGVQTRRDLGADAPDNPATPVLEALVNTHQRTGRRGAGGFYDYDGKNKSLWPGLATEFPSAANQPAVRELIDRFLMVQAMETARVMDAGIVDAPEDADLGAVLGWGFAPYTGGPISYMETMGLGACVARADTLADRYGERFRPPAGLRKMAAEGRRYYGS